MKLPDLLIAADRKHLLACLVLPDGLPEIVETIDCQNDGQTSAPAVDFTDKRDGCRIIAERISRIIARYQPSSWGIACPQDLLEEIMTWLTPNELASLVAIREKEGDLRLDVCNITRIFDSAAPDYDTVKEHC